MSNETAEVIEARLRRIPTYPAYDTKSGDNACPGGLSAAGQEAYHVIMGLLTTHGSTHTGGCHTFYSPKEWAERGEEYGADAELIVAYDGGEVGPWFSMDKDIRGMGCDHMAQELEVVDLFPEECTGWYSAIYCKE